MLQTKVCIESQKTHFMLSNFFSFSPKFMPFVK